MTLGQRALEQTGWTPGEAPGTWTHPDYGTMSEEGALEFYIDEFGLGAPE